MRVTPPGPRYHASLTADGLQLIIPARRNLFIILFLLAWLGGWYFGEASAIRQLTAGTGRDERAFLTFWLIAWTLGGAWAVACVLWMVFGREIVGVTRTELIHRFAIGPLSLSRRYSIADIRRLRTGIAFAGATDWFGRQQAFLPRFGADGGLIKFDYGARTISVGASLDEAEARGAIDQLRRHLPGWTCETDALAPTA
jgi:hypothetical protein